MNPDEPQNFNPIPNPEQPKPMASPIQIAQPLPSPQPVVQNQTIPNSGFNPQTSIKPDMVQQVIQQQPSLVSPPLNAVPSLNNAYLDKSTPGITFGVWSIVTSIIPILGFSLGIVAIIKGFSGHNKNKVLGVLGIIGTVLSIGIAILSLIYFMNVSSPAYGELKVKRSSMLVASNSSKLIDYSFKYPEEQFKEVNLSNVANAVGFEDIDESTTDKSISRIVLIVEDLSVDAVAAYDERIFDTEIGKNLMQGLIADTLSTDFDKLEIASVNLEYEASFGDALQINFSFMPSTDLKIIGTLIFVVDPVNGAAYNFFIASKEDVWNKNVEVFDEVRDSLSNQ